MKYLYTQSLLHIIHLFHGYTLFSSTFFWRNTELADGVALSIQAKKFEAPDVEQIVRIAASSGGGGGGGEDKSSGDHAGAAGGAGGEEGGEGGGGGVIAGYNIHDFEFRSDVLSNVVALFLKERDQYGALFLKWLFLCCLYHQNIDTI